MDNPVAVCVDRNPFSSVEELVEMIARAGLDAIEWFECGPADPWSNPEMAARLRALTRRHELTAQYHAPYEGPCELSRSAGTIRAPGSMAKVISAALDKAERLGARLVTFHPGACPPAADRSEALRSVMEGVLLALPELERRRIRVALENHTPAFSDAPLGDRPEDFDWLMDNISSEWVGRTLDIGHAHIDGNLDGFLARPFDRVFNVHVHDNDGQEDLHLPLEAGTVQWQPVLKHIAQACYQGPLTLEFSAQAEDYLNSVSLIHEAN